MTFDEFVSKQRADLPELDAAMTELEIAYPTTKAYTEIAKKAPWAWGKVYKSAEKGP